jgi:acetyl-CoA carboxylase biotin carboxylase subunit
MPQKRTFKKILIANRGEIALRVIRACRELNISTVGCFTPEDETGGWIRYFDEVHELNGLNGRSGYLNIKALLEVAEKAKADAVHPGYGFLSEQASFAKACQESGIVFIGPSPDGLRKAGDKIMAREAAQKIGIPCLPGTSSLSDWKEALRVSRELGFPVLLKASAGGGGHGMRLVRVPEEMELGFSSAEREAASSFGSGTLYLEKYLAAPRHIEVQILRDSYGRGVYLGERECSIQRRHQKLIEESPSCVVTEEMRREIGQKAIQFAAAIDYTGAGTVEFLYEAGRFYFLEMNARIQVEHPVTEMVTGFDLVKEQIRIAEGFPLSAAQQEIKIQGWAFEARINSEDFLRNFIPVPGTIKKISLPGGPGVRVDTAVYEGYTIPEAFDSLFAKLIVWGKDREEAISRMKRSLLEFEVSGIPTTVPFHFRVFSHPVFQKGEFSTRFIEEYFGEKVLISEEEKEMAALVSVLEMQQEKLQFQHFGERNPWALSARMQNYGIHP